jgi:hypothetical protein
MAVQRHQNTPLIDYTIKLMQDPSVYGASGRLCPYRPVSKMTDIYYVYSTEDAFRAVDSVRGNKVPAARVDWSALSTASFALKTHKLSMAISREDRENSDPSVNPEMDAMDEIMDMIMREKEIDLAKKFFTTTVSGVNNTTLTTNKWSYDTVTSNPIDDVDTAISAVKKATGKKINNMLIGDDTWRTLKDHPELLDRIKWSQQGVLSENLVSALLGVQSLYVSDVITQSNDYGISVSTDFLFKSGALLYFNDPNPRLRNANFGTCFVGLYGGTAPEIRRWRDEDIDSDIIELAWSYDQKIVLSLSGYFISGTD